MEVLVLEKKILINIEARDNQWVLYSTDDIDVLTGEITYEII